MDLRQFYQKIEEWAGKISEDPAIVVSHETADGGKAGVFTEVSRQNAARMIVEGRARLATEEEAAEYRQRVQRSRAAVERESVSQKVQVAVLPEELLAALGQRSKGKKPTE